MSHLQRRFLLGGSGITTLSKNLGTTMFGIPISREGRWKNLFSDMG